MGGKGERAKLQGPTMEERERNGSHQPKEEEGGLL
jgi:hypothetical protein